LRLTLNIINKGVTYTAETLKPVASNTKIVQNDKSGFTGNNKEIKLLPRSSIGTANSPLQIAILNK
jgi:hypothetical protein